MRKSRVLLAGVAVAAAAAATSAFTAGNDFSAVDPLVAGYGQVSVTGAIVTDVDYSLDSLDNSRLEEVVFTTSTDVTDVALTKTMTLKLGSGVVGTYGCTPSAYTPGSPGTMTLTCDATDDPLLSAFDAVGLTVSQ
jgi:hypothetical protein